MVVVDVREGEQEGDERKREGGGASTEQGKPACQ